MNMSIQVREKKGSLLTWFWTRSLTLSMGAAAVLETPAATPDSMKFSAKPNFWPDMMKRVVGCGVRLFPEACSQD